MIPQDKIANLEFELPQGDIYEARYPVDDIVRYCLFGERTDISINPGRPLQVLPVYAAARPGNNRGAE